MKHIAQVGLGLGFALSVALSAAACSSSSSSSDACTTSEIEVDYLGGTRDNDTSCEPLPATCGSSADCSNIDCLRDMYDLCEAPYNGVACSDTFPPVIISCNP